MRIYLVEDSPELRMRLEAMLARVPDASIVGSASGAAEAIDSILATGADVAVVDVRLAQGSGFDVLRALRERAPRVAVYMMSNFATEPYRRLAAALGAKDFFDKSNEFERIPDQIAARAFQTASITD